MNKFEHVGGGGARAGGPHVGSAAAPPNDRQT